MMFALDTPISLDNYSLLCLLLEDVLTLEVNKHTIFILVISTTHTFIDHYLQLYNHTPALPSFWCCHDAFVQLQLHIIVNTQHQLFIDGTINRALLKNLLVNNSNEGIGIKFVDIPNDIDRTTLLTWKELYTNMRSIHICGNLSTLMQ